MLKYFALNNYAWNNILNRKIVLCKSDTKVSVTPKIPSSVKTEMYSLALMYSKERDWNDGGKVKQIFRNSSDWPIEKCMRNVLAEW